MASSLNGTGLTFSSGQTLNSPPVTSVATGNGLSGGTITSTGTLAIAAPTAYSVGSYACGNTSSTFSSASTTGSSYATIYTGEGGTDNSIGTTTARGGTWRCLGFSGTGIAGGTYRAVYLFVRTA